MEKPKKSDWHLAFGEALAWDLLPVGISVYSETLVMTEPPRADILLLRQNHPTWTTEQLKRLPDGIRQTQASHILLEFKHSQSLNEDALIQSLGYDKFYKTYKLSNEFTAQDVQTFLVSAIKPQQETREKLGYEEMRYPGVYESQRTLEQRITLISLNELADEPYNAVFKLFATHKMEKQKAFFVMEHSRNVSSMPKDLNSLFVGLLLFLGEEDMTYELTPEQVRKVGQMWGKNYLKTVPIEERLAGINPIEVMDHLNLSAVPIEKRLAGINPIEVMDHLRLAETNFIEVMDHLKLKPVERLAGLSRHEMGEIEEYLKKLKQDK